MERFLRVVCPVVGNFIIWALITLLPVHFMYTFALLLITGVLMVYALVRLNKQSVESKSTNEKAISNPKSFQRRSFDHISHI